MRYSDEIQTLVTIEEQTIVLWFQTRTIMLKQLRQTSAMASALWLNVTDFWPVFRIIVSNIATRDNLHHSVYTHNRKPGQLVVLSTSG